jgi:hypothetical protein
VSGVASVSGLQTSSHCSSGPACCAPRLTARPYPTLPGDRTSVTDVWDSATASGAPSVDPLSTTTTRAGGKPFGTRESTKDSRVGPGE